MDGQSGQIAGLVRIAGTNVMKIDEMFGLSKSTLSKGMTTFEKEKKKSSSKQNSEENQSFPIEAVGLSCESLENIEMYKSTAPTTSAEPNNQLEKAVSTKNCSPADAQSRICESCN